MVSASPRSVTGRVTFDEYGNQFGVGKVPVAVTQMGRGVDLQGADLTLPACWALTAAAAGDVESTQWLDGRIL